VAAIVQGATDGIGKAYAKELASRGLDVVIVARNPDKLLDVAAELAAAHAGRTFHTIAADFAKPSPELFQRIAVELAEKTAGATVGVLINNVGLSYPACLLTHEVEARAPGLTDQLIAVNITSTVKMTQLVLPGMLEARKGVIVNVASAAGRIPAGNPLLSIYSGTKAFVDFFSRSMHAEYADRGIVVQCQSPYLVSTAMSKASSGWLPHWHGAAPPSPPERRGTVPLSRPASPVPDAAPLADSLHVAVHALARPVRVRGSRRDRACGGLGGAVRAARPAGLVLPGHPNLGSHRDPAVPSQGHSKAVPQESGRRRGCYKCCICCVRRGRTGSTRRCGGCSGRRRAAEPRRAGQV